MEKNLPINAIIACDIDINATFSDSEQNKPNLTDVSVGAALFAAPQPCWGAKRQ